MAKLKVKENQKNPLIGDDLDYECRMWVGIGESVDPLVFYRICRWLVETGSGAEALSLLNDIPRQLWMDFEDREKPWEVDTSTEIVEIVDEEGLVTGYCLGGK